MKIPFGKIEILDEINIRDALDEDTIERYMETFDALPPVTVFEVDGKYILADGFHRMEAARRLECTEIVVELRSGDQREAEIWSAEANLKSAFPLNKAERNKAIIRLYQQGWTQQTIADACGLSPRTIEDIIGREQSRESRESAETSEVEAVITETKIEEESVPKEKGLSEQTKQLIRALLEQGMPYRVIADELQVSQATIAKISKELQKDKKKKCEEEEEAARLAMEEVEKLRIKAEAAEEQARQAAEAEARKAEEKRIVEAAPAMYTLSIAGWGPNALASHFGLTIDQVTRTLKAEREQRQSAVAAGVEERRTAMIIRAKVSEEWRALLLQQDYYSERELEAAIRTLEDPSVNKQYKEEMLRDAKPPIAEDGTVYPESLARDVARIKKTDLQLLLWKILVAGAELNQASESKPQIIAEQIIEGGATKKILFSLAPVLHCLQQIETILQGEDTNDRQN